MGLVADVFSQMERFIIEHGSATIMKERLALLREQMEGLEKENADLKAENAELKEEITELSRRLEQEVMPEGFIKYRGVLFRRLPTGKYEDTVYCPKCKIPMASAMGATPLWCSSCKLYASFTGNDIHKAISELESS